MSHPQPDREASLVSRLPVPASFHCELKHNGRDAAWVTVGGELDIATAPQLADHLEDALTSARLLVLDLRQLSFMDSSGLSLIVSVQQRARRSGRRLVLVQGPVQVTRLLDIAGLTDWFEIVVLRQPKTG